MFQPLGSLRQLTERRSVTAILLQSIDWQRFPWGQKVLTFCMDCVLFHFIMFFWKSLHHLLKERVFLSLFPMSYLPYWNFLFLIFIYLQTDMSCKLSLKVNMKAKMNTTVHTNLVSSIFILLLGERIRYCINHVENESIEIRKSHK